MAKSPGITQVQVTDTFQTWLNKTNELVTLINSDVLTASPGGDTTVGNATLTGNFTANNFTANAAIGVFTGFTGRFSDIRQQAGNNAPINVASMLNITVANTLPIRLTNSLGPRISFDNTNRSWEIGHNTGSTNSSFAFVREGVTLAAISANGDWEGTGSITANGVIKTGNAGRVLAGNGSIAIPSVAFINAPNTGIYFSANTIGFSVENSMKMNIANNGILTLAYGIRSANGTAAVPAHSFNGFGHTGAWYNGNYNISVNGSINMEIGPTGSYMLYGTTGVQISSNTNLDLDANNAVGIRIGRHSTFSKLAILSPGTTVTRVQLVGDEAAASGGQARVAASASQTWPGYAFIGDTDTGVSQYAADSVSLVAGAGARLTANISTVLLNGTTGLSFGTHTANTTTELGDHLNLWGGLYGFNVTGSRLNAVVPNTAVFAINSPSTNFAAFASNWARFSDGTTAAPGISFLDDTDTGIFRYGSGGVGIVSDGVERMRVGGSVLVYGTISANTFVNNDPASGFLGNSSDTATSPTFTWNGDGDTGMWRYGTNNIGLTTGGVNRVVINSSGLTIQNDGRFIASNNGNTSAPDYTFSGAGNYGMSVSSSYLRFSADGTNNLSISSSLVYLNATIRIPYGSAASPSVYFGSNPAHGIMGNSSYVYNVVDNVARYRYDDLGNSGISVINRDLGDARYVRTSSRRFKDKLVKINGSIEDRLLAAFDLFDVKTWIWGKELKEHDERYGTRGIGLVVEELEEFIPEAVRYQWVEDKENPEATPSKKRPHALDDSPIIASLILKIRQLEARLEAIGG